MKVAIAHDGLATFGGRGGAEWVLTVLRDMFPDAPIFTTVYNSERMPSYFRAFDIRPSFIQRLPFGAAKYKAYLPLMPTAIEQFDFSGYDVVLSCSHSVAKGVITPPATRRFRSSRGPSSPPPKSSPPAKPSWIARAIGSTSNAPGFFAPPS